jgi:ribA/ribD-fused uncharacterized protein
MKYSTGWLLEQLALDDARIKYLFFWGHRPSPDGVITKSCLSQWWLADFVVNGLTYRSAEHWMMTEKARLFNDQGTLARILAAPSPAEAKKTGPRDSRFRTRRLGKAQVRHRGDWQLAQVWSAPGPGPVLLATHDRVLVEASPVDTIWGIGLAADAADAANPARWRGPNLLGFALMEVRDQLRTA